MHVQAWGIILIAILIVSLPLKSSDTLEHNAQYSPLLIKFVTDRYFINVCAALSSTTAHCQLMRIKVKRVCGH